MPEMLKKFNINNFNILFIGEPGAGKSCTIKILFSIFKNQFCPVA